MARGAPPPARLRARGRGLARGRDRDRRVAARRALPPAGRADRGRGGRAGRARAARSPRFDLHGGARRLRRASRALRRPSRRGRALDPARAASRRSRRRSPRTPTRELDEDDLGRSTAVDAVVSRARADARPLRASCARLAPFGLGNPGVTLLVAGCELAELGDGRRRQAPALPRPRRAAATRAARSPSASGAQLDRLRRGRPLRRRVPARGEPLERHRRAAARRQAPLRHDRRATPSCASALRARMARSPKRRGAPRPQAIFAELGLGEDGAAWRSLLESATLPRAARGRPGRS